MALVRIPAEDRTITDTRELQAFLSGFGVDYERTEPSVPLPPGAPAADVLAAYKPKIDELNARGGYVTADVIDVFATNSGPRRHAGQIHLRTLA